MLQYQYLCSSTMMRNWPGFRARARPKLHKHHYFNDNIAAYLFDYVQLIRSMIKQCIKCISLKPCSYVAKTYKCLQITFRYVWIILPLQSESAIIGILCHKSINSMINNKSHVHQKLYEKKARKVKKGIVWNHFLNIASSN